MGSQADKFVTLGGLFGTSRSTFQTTAETYRHTTKAGFFVQSGKYTYFNEEDQSGMEGVGTAGSKRPPVITHSPV